MALHRAEERYVIRTETALGVVRGCRLCKFHVFRKKQQGAGRGAGMREGNKQRGVLIQHIKTEHPKEYKEAMSDSV